MMKLRIVLFAYVCFGSIQLFGQAKLRKMPYVINRSSVNNYAPYISLDGNTLVYTATLAEDDGRTMAYSVR